MENKNSIITVVLFVVFVLGYLWWLAVITRTRFFHCLSKKVILLLLPLFLDYWCIFMVIWHVLAYYLFAHCVLHPVNARLFLSAPTCKFPNLKINNKKRGGSSPV